MKHKNDRITQIFNRSPESLLAGSFAAVILLGSVFLYLPVSHHGRLSFIDALFTSTSATCVTGLTVVDTGKVFSFTGQCLILALIQIGGIGVITFAAAFFQLIRRRLSLRTQMALSDSLIQFDIASEFKTVFKEVIAIVFCIELIGAAVLFSQLSHLKGYSHAVYSSIFHSISAFCNAGFSLYSDSLIHLKDNHWFMAAIMLLIMLGGIGHPVIVYYLGKLIRHKRPSHSNMGDMALHSKVVVTASLGLIAIGTIGLLLSGWTPAASGTGSRFMDALFQSVTARTAGFNSIDIGSLPQASLLLLTFLMFIGGSPASCAGGIKTSTFILWLSKIMHLLMGNKGPRLFNRHVPYEIVRRASIIIGLAVIWNFIGCMVLLNTEKHIPGIGLHQVLFEQISAFATVGLSTGITPYLSFAGKIWIISTMFLGRIGPLALAMLVVTKRNPGVLYPEGRVMIG